MVAHKYSVVCDTLAWMGYDFFASPREILETIKAAGYDGADLPGDVERLQSAEMRRIADDIDLEIPEVLGAWAYFHAGEDRNLAGGDPAARQRGLDYARRALDLTAEAGARYFEICAAQPPVYEVPFPKQPVEELRRNFVDAANEICAHAEPLGITVLMEPLNQYEAYPGVLTTLQEALWVIEQVDFENIGMQPDVFHMNISEASTVDALREAGRHIHVVHTNETNHRQLGRGHANYPEILQTLRDVGFDGYLTTYLPITSQAVAASSSGYGVTQASLSAASGERPDLQLVLEEQLRFLHDAAPD